MKRPAIEILIALAAALLLTGGCQRAVAPAPAPAAPQVEPPAPEPAEPAAPTPESVEMCPSPWGAPERAGTIRLALQEAVDPTHAPVPVNDAERLVFRQAYETLVQADCCGNLQPGLAVQWRSLDGGRSWEFELRENACFWDGMPLDRGAIRRAWALRRNRAGVEEAYYPWSWIASVSELDPNPRVLTVELTAPLPRPDLFLHPALAVALDEGASAWPLGSGPFRPEPVNTGAQSQRTLLRLVLHPYHPAGQGGGLAWPAPLATSALEAPSILLVDCSPGVDARDLLAQGADVVWMRSLREIEYAGLTRDYTVTPLPWDRIYAVAAEPSGPERLQADRISRAQLAADAMDSGARSAESLAFANLESAVTDSGRSAPGDCADYEVPGTILAPVRALPAASASLLPGDHLLFEAGDRDAERLAGRLVALSSVAPATTAPVDADMLRAQGARDGAPPCLVRLTRVAPDPCLEPLAQWRPDLRRAVVPLVAVRAHLVTRRGLGGLAVAWDGTPVFSAAGWGATDRDDGDKP